MKEYKCKIGVDRAQMKRRRRKRKANLENLLLLPSAKTGDEGHTCFHLKELFDIFVRVLEMNAKTRARALVFSQFGRVGRRDVTVCV